MKIEPLSRRDEIPIGDRWRGDKLTSSWFFITLDEIELKTHDYLEGREYIGIYKIGVGVYGEEYADPTVINRKTGEDVNVDDLFMEFAGMVEREEFES